MSDNELFSFEGVHLSPSEIDKVAEQEIDDAAEEDDFYGSMSDSEIANSEIEDEPGTSLTTKEIHWLCKRGQKKRPAHSDSESDVSTSRLPTYPKTRKLTKQSNTHTVKKSKFIAPSRSSSLPSTPNSAAQKALKNISRSAPPKNGLLSISKSVTRSSTTPSRSRKDPHPMVGAKSAMSTMPSTEDKDEDREDAHSLSIAVLQEISSKLNSVAERMVRMETKLEAMEKRRTPSSSSDARTPRQKRVIPHTLRLEVRRMYQTLLSEDDRFEGFVLDSGIAFTDPVNKAVTSRLIKEVHAQNPTFESVDIHSAAYTYYRSLSQEQSLKDRGIHEQRKADRRRQGRIQRKLQVCLSTFAKAYLKDSEREKWEKVFISDMMSSEESDSENENIMIKELPFRHERVTSYFRAIDIAANKKKSSQALRQMKKRVVKGVSA